MAVSTQNAWDTGQNEMKDAKLNDYSKLHVQVTVPKVSQPGTRCSLKFFRYVCRTNFR